MRKGLHAVEKACTRAFYPMLHFTVTRACARRITRFAANTRHELSSPSAAGVFLCVACSPHVSLVPTFQRNN